MESDPQPSIAKLRQLERDYLYNPAYNGHLLVDKKVTMVMGITGIGKSTLANAVIENNPGIIGMIGTTTTRPGRPNDPAEYHTGVSYDDFIARAEAGHFVNFFVHENGHAYGTLPEDFHGKYSIGPMVPESVEAIHGAFSDYPSVFILGRHALTVTRLQTHRLDFPDIEKRILEDHEILAFAAQNRTANWLNFVETTDEDDSVEQMAATTERIIFQHSGPNMTEPYALQLLSEMDAALEDIYKQVKKS